MASYRGTTITGTTETLLGHVKNASGDVSAAGIAGIKLRVVDEAAPTVLIVPEVTITPSDVLAALSTAWPWTKNTTGYNFRYEVLPAQIPTVGKNYIFQFQFTPAIGEVFNQEYVISTERTLF